MYKEDKLVFRPSPNQDRAGSPHPGEVFVPSMHLPFLRSVLPLESQCLFCLRIAPTHDLWHHIGASDEMCAGPVGRPRVSESYYALPAGSVLNQYEIVRVLGSGGFGVTYLARDTGLESLVAIKEYLPSDFAVRGGDSQVSAKTGAMEENFGWGRSRFLDEARVLAKFRHPNIVRVFQVFEQNNTAYIVMEYVEGQPLSECIDSRGGLEEAEVREVLLPLIDGLKRIHERGFLHRDIKPSNIILRTGEGPVLIDFGAARQAIETRSRSITSIVTEGYAPLEQYDPAGNQGPWTDVHALGGVAYKCLTCKTPPAATSRIRNDPLAPLETAAKHPVSKVFASAIRWALAVYEEDRPQTMEAFQRAILGQAAPATAPLDASVSASVAAADATVLLSDDATRKLEEPGGGARETASASPASALSTAATLPPVDIFISYSRRDSNWVRIFATALETEGFSVWWDPLIPPGAKYREFISERLDTAKVVVVVWSAEAAKSDFVRDEAEEGKHKLVPVQCEAVLPPHGFRGLQTADLSRWRGDRSSPEFRLLVSGINAQVGRSLTLRTADFTPKKRSWWKPLRKFSESTGGKFAAAAIAAAMIMVFGVLWISGRGQDDSNAWSNAMAADNIPAYQTYLGKHGSGRRAADARRRIDVLRDQTEHAWVVAERANTETAYHNFMRDYGKNNLHLSEAAAAVSRLHAQTTRGQQRAASAQNEPIASPDSSEMDSGAAKTDSPEGETHDCTASQYPDERAICQNSALSALDRRMNEAYHSLRDRQPDHRLPSDALNYARQALVERHNCGTDVGCITAVLLAEKNFYERYVSQQ